jgi:hypothetical protein
MASGGFAIAAVPKEEGCRRRYGKKEVRIATVWKKEGLPQLQFGKGRVRRSGGMERGRLAAGAVWQVEGSL